MLVFSPQWGCRRLLSAPRGETQLGRGRDALTAQDGRRGSGERCGAAPAGASGSVCSRGRARRPWQGPDARRCPQLGAEGTGSGARRWMRIPALPLTSWVARNEVVNFTGPQFPHLWNVDQKNFVGFCKT